MTINYSEIIQIISELVEVRTSKEACDRKIAGETFLVKDLGMSSVDFVVIFEKIQKKLGKTINFIDLIMPNRSSYIEDLSINELTNFLSNNRDSPRLKRYFSNDKAESKKPSFIFKFILN